MSRLTPARSLFLLLGCLLGSRALADIPANEPPLSKTLNSANNLYQLRYTDNIYTSHYMPSSQVQASTNALERNGASSQGNPRGYHNGYIDLGFRAPFFKGGVRDVTFWDCKDPADPDDFDCDNGFAVLEQIVMPAPTYKGVSESCLRMILGHELFHHVEFAHTNAGGGEGCGGTFGTTVCEGQARAMQDKVYFDLDLSPGASCIASFRGDVNNYLGNPDQPIWQSSYRGALFWTYLMEQYGTFAEEPYRGADFLSAWWELAEDRVDDPDVVDITEQTIQLFEPKQTLINTYQDFTIANLMKNFSLLGIPASARARYSYIDEQPVLNQNNTMSFNAVTLSDTATVAGNQTINRDFDAQQLGGDYLRFDISACPAGSTMEFEVKPNPGAPDPTPNAQALISLLLTKAPSAPIRLWKWRASSAKASAVQAVGTPFQYAYFIVSGRNSHYQGRATVRCKPAPLAPIVKFSASPAQPGPGGSPIGTVKLAVPDGSTPGQMLTGLDATDFRLQIGGQEASIESAIPDGDGYLVRFRHPPQSTAGPFALSATVGAQTTTIGNAIRYDAPSPEVMVVLDLTQSVQTTGLLLPAIQKVREAARRMQSTSKFGLVAFFGNGTEPDLDAQVLLSLAPLSSGHRASLESVLSSLSASPQDRGAPGDGIQVAIDEFNARGGSGSKSILLLSDGGIGEGRSVADLAPALNTQRISVHAIAMGARSNQVYHQDLGRETSGSYHYVPTLAGGLDNEALTLAMDASQAAATREHVLLARQVAVPAGAATEQTIRLDSAVLGSSGVVLFAVETAVDAAAAPSAIQLFRPDGQEVITAADVEIVSTPRARYFRLNNASNGDWLLRLSPNGAGGASNVDLKVIVGEGRAPGLLAALAKSRQTAIGDLSTGDPVVVAGGIVSEGQGYGVHLQVIHATLEAPDGSTTAMRMQRRSKRAEAELNATEPAQTAEFDRLLLGLPAGLVDDPATGGTRGSYRVVLDAEYGTRSAPYHLRTTSSFVVLSDSTDADTDGLPDRWEQDRTCTLSAATGTLADPDQDGLDNASERSQGTDPCLADTDEGGELDGSEVAQGRDPRVPDDDAFSAQPNLFLDNQYSQHEAMPVLPPNSLPLRYDVDAQAPMVRVFRGTDVQGPYQLLATLTGAARTGRYLDTGLPLGQTYCYRVQSAQSSGASSEMSVPVCATVRANLRAPTGMLTLANGANQSSAGVVTARIDLDHDSPIGAAMRFREPDGNLTGWLVFQPSYSFNVNAVPRPATIRAEVQLRDADGNESEWYGDELDLIDAGSVGAVQGRARGGVNVAVGDVNIRVLNQSTLPAQFSDANGQFQLPDLPPGTYQLEFSHPEYFSLVRTITVSAGAVTDLGDVILTPDPGTLFVDSFE